MKNEIKRWLAVGAAVFLAAEPAIQPIYAGDNTDTLLEDVKAPSAASLQDTKDGIVKIESGLLDEKGQFILLKQGSGILLSNSSDGACMLTVRHNVVISEKEKNAYYTKKKIKKENQNFSSAIRVVVKGDTTASVEVIADSEEQDFSLLRSDNVVSEKTPVYLENSIESAEGDTVSALGFSEDAADSGHTQYVSEDVEVHEGSIQDTKAESSGVPYLQHSALLDAGNDGGALINQDGYIIGLNNAEKNNPETGAFYALPVTEIIQILDNYDILYQSHRKCDLYRTLYEACTQGAARLDEEELQSESKVELTEGLQKAVTVLKEQAEDENALSDALTQLQSIIKDAHLKMSKLVYVCIGLFALLVFLLICFIRLLLWKRKQKNGEYESDVTIGAGTYDKNGTEEKQELLLKEEQLSQEKTQKSETEKSSQDQGWSSHEIASDLVRSAMNSEKTVFLNQNRKRTNTDSDLKKKFQTRTQYGRLLRLTDCSVNEIDQPEYRIGKNPEICDLTISNNRAISRLHATICWSPQGYLLLDNDSSNGSFVNGKQVSKEGILLADRDQVLLADEEFEFRLISG